MKTHNIGIKTFLLLALLLTGGMASAQVQINGNVYGGGNLGIVTENTTVTVNGGTIGRKLTFDERSNDENGQVIHVDNGNVYGGGNGFKIDSYRRINKDDGYGVWALDVPNINPNYGLVKGNTNVTVSGNAVVRRAVYGGGNVATVGFAGIPQATGIADYTSGGKTTVTIEGHALIGPKKEDLTMDDAGNALPQADIDRNFKYLGANEGFVFGSSRGISGGALKHLSFADTTIVTITGNAQVAGHVFGGGENGHVQKGTNVIIKGDAIIGGVPLHGDSTGVAAGTQMVYTVSGGEYDGVTLYLNKEEGELNEDIYGVGHRVFRGNVFGGGKGTDFISWWKEQHGFNKYCYTAGRVYGNTHVAIEENAQIYNRVYGGGTIASVGTFKHEDSSNANAVTNIESGGHSYVTVSNGIIGSPGSDGKNCGEVFGGGRGIPGRPRKGTESFMTLHQLPDEAYVGHTHVLVSGGTIMNSVYGGAANGHVQGDANVRITDGTIGIEGVGGWHGNVYAGGGGTDRYTEDNAKKHSLTAGRVFGNTNLNITGGTIMHNVYGGGALASVGTYLKYKGVEQAYFGGGKATLNITGGTIGTNGDNNGMVYGSGRGEIMAPDQIMDTLTYMAYTFVNIGKNNNGTYEGDAKIKGSVYGSGENGHVYLESHVNVYSGTIGIAAEDYDPYNPDPHFAYRGNVYGAGCGTDKYDSDNDGVGDTYNPNSGYVWGQTEVNIYGGYISRSVYGAGAMASVGFIDHTRTKKHHYINHESEPSLSWPYELTYGKITDSLNHVYPSEEGVFTGKSTVNVFGGHIGTLAAPIAESGNVFGSARGDVGPLGVMDTLAIVRETEVNVNFTPPTGEITNATPNVIIGSVYGSGENGTVYENTKVTLTNGLVRGSVFGGGDGTDTYMVALKDPNNPSQYLDPSPQRSITSGKVYGNTEVVINGGQVLHNVFGGGNFASVGKGSYMGYGEMSASSITPSPTPYENSGTCTVTVTGGTIGTTGYPGDGYNNGFVFGSSKGTTFATVDNPEGTALYDYSRDFFLGYSNETEVIIGNPETDPLVDDGPRIWGSVFGGGENGHVRWHTNVTVNKGEIGKGYDAFSSVAGTPDMTADSMVYLGNVYGAGRGIDTIPIYTPGQPPQYCNLAGSVTLNTNVTVNGGIIHRNVYGGGSNASVGPSSTGYNPGTSTCTVNIKGGNIGEEFAVGEESFLYGGNIFGASRGSKVLIGTANIGLFATVNNTDVNIDSLRQGATVINTADVIGNVYGGGEVGQVTINTNVDMAYGNVKGSVYGGGKGVVTDEKAALVKGNATVNMTNGTVERSVYGGGQLGNVGTYTGYYTAEEIQNTAHVLNEPKGCEENTGMATVKISGGMVGKNGSLMPSPTSNPDDDDRGWVFCGGRGYADTIASGCQKANLLGIVGTTYLEISETDDTKPVITASVYGGCENGLTLGNTHVKIMGGQIGTGHNGGATNPWDEPYSEPLWTQAIAAINGGNPTTINNIAAQFHECDAFPYGIDHDEDPSTPDEYYVYDIFADETGYNSQGGSKQGSNGHSFFGNVFGGGSGYYPIAAGVWRRSAGRVWGDTRVEIEGGHILNNVYGGNETTDVMGKCTVTMEGGTVGIPRTIAQIEALPAVGVLFGGSMGDPRRAFDKWANVKETEVSVTGGTIFGSVFGGSAVGHVLEDAEVSISQAEGKTTLIGTWGYSGYDGSVFGGGKGDECNIDPVPRDNTTNPPTPAHPSFTPGRVGGNAHVAMSNGKVLGCLYGGGFSALTGVGENGSFDSFINGSVYDSEHHGKTTVEVSGGSVGNLANDEGLTMLRSANKVGNVYGGGSGNPNENREDDLGRVANAVVNITNSPAIYGSVFGGGQMANVGHWNNYQSWYTEGTGFTQVTIEGSPTIGTALEFDHDHYATLNPPPTKTWYDTINGVRMISHTRTGNVYGGGQGNVTIDGQGYVVGTEHGHCHATYVNIGMNNGDDGGHIMSSVFGGSEEGAVWGETEVHITGGIIGTEDITSDSLVLNGTTWSVKPNHATYSFGSVFGGSYGKDIYKHLNINSPTQQQLDSVNNLAGHVYGNTLVDITGGAIRGNVFGGGNMASVGIWDKVLDGNDNLIDIVAKKDPDRPAFRGNATVNVGGEAVIGPLDNTGLNAFVFGGGKGFSYDPDELRKAYSNVDSTFVTISGGKIWGSVYGGGSDSHVLGSTSVIVHSGANIGDDGRSTWDGNIFGGGRNFLNSNHTNGRVAGNVTVDMDGGTIQGSVFGGGRMALTGVNMLGNPYVTEHVYDSAFNNKPIHGLATINVSGTATTANGVTTYSTNIGNPNGNELLNGSNESVGDVFGSGKGDTKNYEDILAGRVANTKVGISGSPRIYGSVFGGGEMAGVGYWYTEDGKAKFYDKSGTSEVTIGREGESDNPVIGTDYEFTQEYAATNPEWTIYDDDGTIIHTCTGNVFGGCQGDVNITAPHWVSMGRSRNAKVVVNGGTIKSRVFGGAEQGSMAGNTSVVINGGTIGTLVTMSTNGGGGNGDGRDGETQYYIGGVYGGGYGSHNPAYNVTHNNDSTNISSDLLAGRVYGNARVDVLGGTVQGSVFGGASFAYLGGYGTNPHGNAKVYIGSESQMGNPGVGTTILGGVYGANNYNGTPYGDVEVHVYHTAHTGQPTTAGGNAYPTVPASGATPEWLATIPNDADNFALYQVFGGGNRANYTPKLAANKATVHVYGCEENTIYELYGGGNAAEIGSATAGYTTDANVIIEGGRIHSVFGGGNGNPDPANIYGIATTTVEGGLIDELFGGSNGYGNVNEINLVVAEDSDCELVIVNGFGGGNTSPEIGEIVTTLECCANPTPYNNFYGGAHSAVIYGNVTLNVYGGRITNLFGGSEGTQDLPADIKKYPTDWQTGDYSDEVKAFMQNHQDLAGTGGNVTVNLYGGTHTNVFGGCDVNGNIEGVVTVNVLDVEGNCPLKIANIYGASNETPYTPDDIIVEDVPQKPVSPVINVVHIKDTDGISQNVFGAGKGNTATVTSNPMVNIGYNHATMAQYIPLDANGNSIYHVQGRTPRAYVKGSVYGGGEYGKVIGNPGVNINRSNTVVDNFVYGAGCGNDTDIDCAKVTGGTTVRIKDGLIKRSVFGGGEMAIVTGDTKVEMSGGTVGSWETIGDEQYLHGSIYGGGQGSPNPVNEQYMDAADYGRVNGNTYIDISGNAHILKDVYGGGQMGSVGNGNLSDNTTGVAHVTISGGQIGPFVADKKNANVYGGGQGEVDEDYISHYTTHANVDSTSVIVCDSALICGNVFGGSANGHVLAGTRVLVEKGTNTKDKKPVIGTTGLHDDGLVFGGGQGTSGSFSAGRVGGSTEVIMTDGTVLGNIYGGGAIARTGVGVDGDFVTFVHEQVYDSIHHGLVKVEVSGGSVGNHDHEGLDLLLSDNRVGNIYGGGRGDLNEFREDDLGRAANAFVRITNSPTIYGSVYGGGQMANVGHWNDYDDRYTQKTGATKVTIDGTPTIGTEKEFDYAYSTGTGANAPKWTLYEVINGMRMITYTRTGNVYGSGQGNIKLDNDGYVVGTEHGHCRTTEVNISGTPTVMSSVYGGAEQGAVWGDTKVNITGGTIGTENIVAGNSDYYSYGSVYGGSYGMDAYTHLNLTNPSQQVLDSVNGLAGHVYGNTFVNITGGEVRCNVFGGGDMASVGEWDANFVPESNTGKATVNVGGTAKIGPMDGTGLNAYVFGGGKGIGNDPYNLRKEYCNVNSTNVTVELNEAGDNVGRVYGSLYGGGSDCHVLGDTYVTLNSGVIGTYDAEHSTISSWGGNIFGGGRNFLKKNYAAGRVAGNTHVEMKGGTVYGAIFGGGRHAVTGVGLDGMTMLDGENHGNTNVEVKGGIVGCEDIVTSFIDRPIGEVYGGGKGSMVGITLPGHPSASALFISLVKNTNVEISQANPAVPTRILNTVYGGGETANVGHYTWTTDPNGYEISNIAMKPGTGKTNVTIKGGIIGVDRSVMSYALVPGTYTLASNPVGNVFGGGKGLSDNPANYAQGISTVYGLKNLVDIMGAVGSTTVTVENTSETIRPWVKGSVFGGSASGHVLRDTEVTIAGGQIGAGNSGTADVWYTDGEDNNQFFNPIEYFETEHTDLDDVASEDALYECYHWPYNEPYRPFDILEIAAGNSPCDGKTWFGNVYGGGSGFLPYITRNYNDTADTAVWNRESGKVYGNTKVTITGGHILTNVYGGCETADVGLYDDNLNNISGGNDTIIMTGGTIGVPRTLAQIAAHPLTCYLFGAGKGDPRTQFDTWTNVDSVYVEVSGGIIYGSVFGGGEEGHVMNDVEVVIKDEAIIGTSYVEGNVFGGGRGYSGEALTAGTVGGNVKVDIQDGVMLGSVYGGGCLASVGTHFTAPENDNYGQFQEDTDDKTHGYVTIDISGGRIGNTHEYLYSPDPEHPEKKLEATYGGNVFAGAMGRLTKLDGTTINPLWPSLGKVKQTEVTVSGNAEIWSSVYGGGQFGTVRDNATVNIMGGTIGTDVKHPDYNGTSNNKHYHFGSVYGGGFGSKDMRYDGTYANDSTESNLYKRPVEIAGRVYGNTFVNISGGQVLENVFGGGEVASVGMVKDGNFVKGVATVIVNGGEVGPMDMNGLNAHVYGGSKGVDKDEDNAYKAYCNVNETHVTVEKHIGEGGDVVSSPHVWGSVFGGGSDGHVLGDAAVNFNGGTLGSTGETTLDGNIFGGGRNFSASNLTAGRVGGNATVTVTEGHMLGSIFGGGRLGSVGIDEDGNMQEGNNHGFTLVNVGGDIQTGEIKIGHGAANDHDRVGGNVYGGGKGIADAPTTIYPQLAKVKETKVNIREKSGKETWIEGSVFGSGEDGHVLQDTYVNIYGGQIGGHDYGDLEPCNDPYHGNVYGGGRGVDTYEDPEHPGTFVYSTTAGWVQGNTNVNMYGGHVVRNVYGGGNLASVGNANEAPDANGNYHTGLASVTIVGGTVGTINENENFGNVFGSGHGGSGDEYVHLAYVKNTHVTIGQTAQIYGSVFGGGEDGHVRKNAIVDIEGGIIGDADDVANQPLDGNVYGGGRGLLLNGESQTAGEVYGYTTVNIKNSTDNGTDYSPEIWNNVFGGGSQSVVQQYKVVNVSGGLVHGSVFGGSREIPTQRPNKAPRFVNMWGGTVDGDVYGCSYQGIDGDPANNKAWASFINLSGGTVQGNVYGAGYQGEVKGSVGVLIGKNAIEKYSTLVDADSLRPSSVTKAPLDIKGSVYGGSNFSGSQSPQPWRTFDITGYCSVYIDGDGYKTGTTGSDPEMIIRGGLFGSGTNCESGAAGRDIVIRNYGERDMYHYQPSGGGKDETSDSLVSVTRTFTTIQRVGNLFLDKANIALTGARDISNLDGLPNTYYGVYQVDTSMVVSNGSSILLGNAADPAHIVPAYIDSVKVLRSVKLNESIYDKFFLPKLSYTWIGVKDTREDGLDVNLYYYRGPEPLVPLDRATEENVIIFKGLSQLFVRYHIGSENQYGELQGFFRMSSPYKPRGTESFAYARQKVTSAKDANTADGGFASYFSNYNFFTDDGEDYTMTKQYPYTNIITDPVLGECRGWFIPEFNGNKWYVDGTGTRGGNNGLLAINGGGHFPDKPKLTIVGSDDASHSSYSIMGDNSVDERYRFNSETDIIYVVGAVSGVKELVNNPSGKLGPNKAHSTLPLRIYRYPGGHKMSNNMFDGGADYEPTSLTDSIAEGPGPWYGTLLSLDVESGSDTIIPKKNLVMDSVMIDGLYGVTLPGELNEHLINVKVQGVYNQSKIDAPLVTVKADTIQLKGNTELKRGYNNHDALANVGTAEAPNYNFYVNPDFDNSVINGGGVYVAPDASANVQVEGIVTITGNKQKKGNGSIESNVYLPTFQKHIEITNQLDPTAVIGVTSPNRNTDKYFWDNTLSPVAKGVRLGSNTSFAVLDAKAAWTNNNFRDDQNWFFSNGDKDTYYLEPYTNMGSYQGDGSSVYFGWTWGNVVRTQPSGYVASGDNDENITISSEEGLAWLISQTTDLNGAPLTNFSGKTISLVQDLNLKQYVWVPVGSEIGNANNKKFSGTFDGRGHLIDSLAIEFLSKTDRRYQRSNYGLFGDVYNGRIDRTFVVRSVIVPDSISIIIQREDPRTEYNIGGLAGYLEGTSVVSNSEAAITIRSCDTYTAYAGGLVGELVSGEIHSSMAMPDMTIKGTSSMAGGLVGKSSGGSVNNSFVNAKFVFKNGGQGGGLLGFNGGTKVRNCYVALRGTTASDNFDGLVKTQSSGSIDSCYVQNGYTFANSGSFNKNFTPVFNTDTYGYMYSDNKVLDADTAMFRLLNHWVDKTNKTTQKYAHWTRPTLHSINGDLPVLMLCNYDGTGEEGQGDFRSLATFKQGVALQYGGTVRDGSEKELSTMLGRTEDVLVYGDILEDLKDVQVNATKVAIYEHAAILKPGKLGSSDNTYVGVTFDNTSRKAVDAYGNRLNRDWHMFSTPLSNAPLGIDYSVVGVDDGADQNENGKWVAPNSSQNKYVYNHWDNTSDDLPAFHFYQATSKDGYFPSAVPTGYTNPNGPKYKYPYDFFCWYEPDWQWINFKRNGVSHWHYDEDISTGHSHDHIDYKQAPDSTEKININESIVIPGKGYQMAIQEDTYMQSHGKLNNGNVTIDVTNTGGGWGVGPLYFGNNLIGNPYHAYLDFVGTDETNGFGKKNGFNSYYVYDADTAAKRNVDYLIYPEDGSVGGCYASRYIHPHQGFFVQYKPDDNNRAKKELTFTTSMIVTRKDVENAGFREELPAYPLVNLFAYDWEDKGDVLVVEFNRPENGGGIKSKSLRNGNHLVFAHHGDNDYGAFFAKEGTKQVPVRFQSFEKEKKPYTFRWNLQNGDFRSLYLIDNMTGIQYDMLRNDSYSFEASKQDYLSRFLIVFDVTDVEEHTEDINFAFFDGSSWVVNGKGRLEVVDVLGRILHAETLHGDQNRVSLDNYAKGIYLLRLWEGDTPKIQKIIMH